jgi:hypothetical protein
LVPSPVIAPAGRRPGLADQLELGFRRGFGEEVVHAGLGRDGAAVSWLSPVIMTC